MNRDPTNTEHSGSDTAATAVQTTTLRDGRALAWHEYGDPDGVPCIYTTGTPASGLAGALYDEVARRAGVRWISIDKPGYGLSDFQPGRRLLDWPQDIGALAAHLGLQRFAVTGESGGGPHALALAHTLESRITTAVVLAGLGPTTRGMARKGMRLQNRLLMAMAQRSPWAIPRSTALMGWMLSNPRRAQRLIRSQTARSPLGDRQLLEDAKFEDIFVQATRDAFRSGPRGAAQELIMLARPWGFDLADVSAHVDLWHGSEDINVPLDAGRAVAEALPNCDARFVEGAGHLVGWSRQDEIMNAITAAA